MKRILAFVLTVALTVAFLFSCASIEENPETLCKRIKDSYKISAKTIYDDESIGDLFKNGNAKGIYCIVYCTGEGAVIYCESAERAGILFEDLESEQSEKGYVAFRCDIDDTYYVHRYGKVVVVGEEDFLNFVVQKTEMPWN